MFMTLNPPTCGAGVSLRGRMTWMPGLIFGASELEIIGGQWIVSNE